MKARMAFLLETLPHLGESTDLPATFANLRDATMIRGAGTKKDWPSEELYKTYSEAVTNLRKAIDRIKEKINFDAEKALPAAETGLRLLALAGDVGQAYDDEKRDLVALDFNDLLINAGKLLNHPERKQLRKRWAANFEKKTGYQDANLYLARTRTEPEADLF